MKGGKRKRLEALPDDVAPINPIDQKHLPYGEEKSLPMEEPREPVSNTQVAVQGDETREGVERPTIELPKGFYEVEAIRSKRMRKGRKQYLIKWLGWPESENTWEPLKNLRGVCHLIKAFKKSNKSAKQRKHRGKQVAHETLTEREQCCTTPCNPRPLSIGGINNHQQYASRSDVAALPPTVALADGGDKNADVIRWRKGKQPMEVGSTSPADPTADRREEDGYDPKLVELIATSSMRINGVHADGLAVNAQLTNTPSGNCHVNGPSMIGSREPEQNERRKGAKKRKSGPVRRFIKVPHESEPVEQVGAAVLATGDNNGDISQVHTDEHNIDVAKIIKILKRVPPHESDTGELYLIFEALRSNGEIKVVSSDYLLESNPKLLARYLMKNTRQDKA